MTKHVKSYVKRLLSAMLCMVMILTLAMPAQAAGDGSETENATEDAVYLPFTVRDAQLDGIMFNTQDYVLTDAGNTAGYSDKNYFNTKDYKIDGDELGFLNEMLDPKTKLPKYTEDSIKKVANKLEAFFVTKYIKLDYSEEDIANTNIHAALSEKFADVEEKPDKANKTEKSGKYDGTFKSIYNLYDAAEWILDNMWTSNSLEINEKEDTYLIENPVYHSMKLSEYEGEAGTNVYNYGYSKYYYFTSFADTAFDMEEGVMYNTPYDDNKFVSGENNVLDEINMEGVYRDGNTYYVDFENNINNYQGNRKGTTASNQPLEGMYFFPLTYTADQEDVTLYDDNYSLYDKYKDKDPKGTLAFTSAGNGKFVYHKEDDLFFGFMGDDDVLLYINGKLILDMGQMQSSVSGFVRLESFVEDENKEVPGMNHYSYTKGKSEDALKMTWAQYLGLEEGGVYDFQFYHMERASACSSFAMYTNIKVMDAAAVPMKTAYLNEQKLSYGAMVKENTDITYGFSLANTSEDVPVSQLTFKDEMLNVTLTKDEIELGGTELADLKYAVYQYGNEEAALYQPVGTEDNLKNLLANGLKPGDVFSIRGFKYNVGSLEKGTVIEDVNNTVYTTVVAPTNNGTRTIPGSANMRLSVGALAEKTVVIDYGKELVMNNESLFGQGENNELNALQAGSTEGEETFYTVGDLTLKDGQGKYGTLELTGDSNESYALTYTPEDIMSGVEKFTLEIPITMADNREMTLTKDVTIVPANIMYYETDFADEVFELTSPATNVQDDYSWKEMLSTSEADGPQDDGTIGQNLYGYDSTYNDDLDISNGSSYMVHGKGVRNTLAKFSFTGTGFDIISRTGAQQGSIRVDVYTDPERTAENRVKSITVLNKSEANLTLYQIPVVSAEMKEYGTYYVTIGVSAAYTDPTYEVLTRGDEFFFDAIRVYNTIDEIHADYDIANAAYTADGEANMELKEVRNMLIDDEKSLDGNADSAVFIDSKESASFAEYKAIGPNNEVYLFGEDQVIGFAIGIDDLENLPTSLDIGAKAVYGATSCLSVAVHAGDSLDPAVEFEKEIKSGTVQFYDLLDKDVLLDVLGEEKDLYVYITNTGTGILSITDLKIAYGNGATPIRIYANRKVLAKAISHLNKETDTETVVCDVLTAEFTTPSIKRKTVATLKVTTSEMVENLMITNTAGTAQNIEIVNVENSEGVKTWTVQFKITTTGTREFMVSGYGANGETGTTASASIKVTR